MNKCIKFIKMDSVYNELGCKFIIKVNYNFWSKILFIYYVSICKNSCLSLKIDRKLEHIKIDNDK